MPSAEYHLRRADDHRKVAEALLADEVLDWYAVALFYSALHEIDAVLANEPMLSNRQKHPGKHAGPPSGHVVGRNDLVRVVAGERVAIAYRSLYELSRRARYDGRGYSKENFRDAGRDYTVVMEWAQKRARKQKRESPKQRGRPPQTN
jgi:hypothetical protein